MISTLTSEPLNGDFVLTTLVGDEQLTIADHHAPIQRTRHVQRQVGQGLLAQSDHVDVLQAAYGIKALGLPHAQQFSSGWL